MGAGGTLLRIERGQVDGEELAAVVAVLLALTAGRAGQEPAAAAGPLWPLWSEVAVPAAQGRFATPAPTWVRRT